MSNLEIWNKLKQPPKEALKTIIGGRLKGMSDINPQWRYQAMTEVFGVCGFGWKYEIVRIWNESAPEGQVLAFAEVKVYTSRDIAHNTWSDPIPATGGSMLVEKESKGLHVNDEGYKMAITDALGTAMKMLGVAADVYMGKFSGSKYKDAPPVAEETEAAGTVTPPPAVGKVTPPPAAGKGNAPHFEFLKVMAKQKARVGDEMYYKILGGNGFEHANEITDRTSQETIFKILLDMPDAKEAV